MAKIVIVPKWVMPFGYGLTLWKLCLVREDSADTDYVTFHELQHVQQWTSIGLFKFPYQYIKELIKNGYLENKFEVEARQVGSEKATNKRLYGIGKQI